MKHPVASVLVVVAVVATILFLQTGGGVPAYFDKTLTYPVALQKSQASGRPVFALVSADWCGPCHEFEGGALADNRVAAWITANTVPVFLDITKSSSPGVAAATELGTTSIPAIYLIRGGIPVGAHAGVMDADSLLNWLDTFSRQVPTPAG